MDSKQILPHLRLTLNIDKPDFEGLWHHGYEAAQNMISEDENPHDESTDEARFWNDGWWAGFYEEEPVFESSEIKNNKTVSTKSNDLRTLWQKFTMHNLVANKRMLPSRIAFRR